MSKRKPREHKKLDNFTEKSLSLSAIPEVKHNEPFSKIKSSIHLPSISEFFDNKGEKEDHHRLHDRPRSHPKLPLSRKNSPCKKGNITSTKSFDQTEPTVRELLQTCLREGHLLMIKSSWKSWRSRWIILSPANKLFYFKDLNDSQPEGVILLSDYIKAREFSESFLKKATKKLKATQSTKFYCFELIGFSSPRVEPPSFTFCSSTKSEVVNWVSTLNQVLTCSPQITEIAKIQESSTDQSLDVVRSRSQSSASVDRSRISPNPVRPLPKAILAPGVASILSNPNLCAEYLTLCWSLHCHVAEGRDLPGIELIGHTNPYVVVKFGGQQSRTKTVWRNKKNPQWGEDLSFLLDHKTEFAKLCSSNGDNELDSVAITAIVFHENNSKHEIIGKVEIPLNTLSDHKLHQQWYPVIPMTSKGYVAGCIRLQLLYKPPVKYSPELIDKDNDQLFGKGALVVKVVEARDLAEKDNNGLSDPYCKLQFVRVKKKTRVVRKNLQPIFNEEFVFSVTPEDLESREELHLVMMDWDKVGAHDFMGRVDIPLLGLPIGVWHDEWYILCPKLKTNKHKKKKSTRGSYIGNKTEDTSPCEISSKSGTIQDQKQITSNNKQITGHKGHKKGHLGDLRLKLRWNLLRILPSHYYEKLKALVIDDDAQLVLLLGHTSDDKETVAITLANICHAISTKKAGDILSTVGYHEIQSSDDPNVIFRGNSITTKLIDAYQKMVGNEYLMTVIQPLVLPLYEEKRALEIDPSKLDKEEDREKNISQLKAVLDEFASVIFASSTQCPRVLKRVYYRLRQDAMEKFHFDEQSTLYFTVISCFFFLRLVCPAILNPNLFKLTSDHPKEHTARTLTLIAKALTNLSNLSDFSQKESYMLPLNDFLDRNSADMKQFLNSLALDGPEEEIGTTIWIEQHLSELHHHLNNSIDKIRALLAENSLPPFLKESKVREILAELEALNKIDKTFK